MTFLRKYSIKVYFKLINQRLIWIRVYSWVYKFDATWFLVRVYLQLFFCKWSIFSNCIWTIISSFPNCLHLFYMILWGLKVLTFVGYYGQFKNHLEYDIRVAKLATQLGAHGAGIRDGCPHAGCAGPHGFGSELASAGGFRSVGLEDLPRTQLLCRRPRYKALFASSSSLPSLQFELCRRYHF